jgi:hypothetical protein
MISPFLTIYQTDRPMVPFIAQDLYAMTKNVLQRFIKRDVIDGITSIVKLLNIDIKDKDTYKAHKKIDIGFEAEQKLHNKVVSEKQAMEIRMDCRKFCVATAAKIIDRSPLKYPITG